MTKICYDGQRWSSEVLLFRSFNMCYGPQASYHGESFGGTSAYALLGPDIVATGGGTHNPPRATGPGWDQDWNHAAMGGPATCFAQDANNDWKRGHLLNGEWGGPGDVWINLVALTAGGNANHATVEAHIRALLIEFHRFDRQNGGHQPYWYCIQYWVQAASDPWSANNAANELYSYCPNMIRATWRVMRLDKPVGGGGTTFGAHLTATSAYLLNPPLGALAPASVAQLAHDGINVPPALPAVLTDNVANQGEAGGGVHAIPVNAPAIGIAGANDGTVEVFQD